MIGRNESKDAESFDQAWSSRSTQRPRATPRDTAALVRTAELLCRSASIQPSEEFSADLRTRLMTEAAQVLVVAPKPAESARAPQPLASQTRSSRGRRLSGLAAALVTGTAAVGLVASSASAVPGDVLYPVKRGVESVQLAVHRDAATRGETQLAQASERLTEAWSLDSTGRDDRVAEALDAFSEQASAGSASMFEAYDSAADTARISAVTSFASDSSGTLVRMSDDLPADAQTALQKANATVLALAEQASALCTSCAEVDLGDLDPAGPGSIVGSAPDTETSAAPSTNEGAASSEPTSGAPAPEPVRASPSPAPRATSPSRSTPSPSKPAPALRDVTDPLIGGLLGDDDQTGIVPSLLDGLLGKN